MVPYANATTGYKAREDIAKLLEKFECQSVGFMDEFNTQSVLLAFTWRGRNVQLRASAKGWAAMYLRENPWNSRKRKPRAEYEQAALDQGMIAVNSILRDWVKGQITAIECGLMPFEHVFLPYMLTSSGVTIAEEIGPKLLSSET